MAAGHVHVKSEPCRMHLRHSSHRWRASQLVVPKMLCSKAKVVARSLGATFRTVDSYTSFTDVSWFSNHDMLANRTDEGRAEDFELFELPGIISFLFGTSQNFQSFYSESSLALGFLLDVFLAFGAVCKTMTWFYWFSPQCNYWSTYVCVYPKYLCLLSLGWYVAKNGQILLYLGMQLLCTLLIGLVLLFQQLAGSVHES